MEGSSHQQACQGRDDRGTSKLSQGRKKAVTAKISHGRRGGGTSTLSVGQDGGGKINIGRVTSIQGCTSRLIGKQKNWRTRRSLKSCHNAVCAISLQQSLFWRSAPGSTVNQVRSTDSTLKKCTNFTEGSAFSDSAESIIFVLRHLCLSLQVFTSNRPLPRGLFNVLIASFAFDKTPRDKGIDRIEKDSNNAFIIWQYICLHPQLMESSLLPFGTFPGLSLAPVWTPGICNSGDLHCENVPTITAHCLSASASARRFSTALSSSLAISGCIPDFPSPDFKFSSLWLQTGGHVTDFRYTVI